MPPAPHRILVLVGGDLIGDALYKTALVFALRNGFPTAELWWGAERETAFASSLKAATAHALTGAIERIDLSGDSGWALHGRFDLVIDTRKGLAAARLAKTTLAPSRFISAAGLFTASDAAPDLWRRLARPTHIVDRLLLLASVATGKPADPQGALMLPEDARIRAAVLTPEAMRGRGFIGCVPGAGDQRKRWPLDRFIAVAQALAGDGFTPVFVLGPNEAGIAPQISAALPQALVAQMDGLSSWPVTVALGERLALALCNDSGTAHMLAQARTPLVCLFGPTAGAKHSPRTPRLTVISAQRFGAAAMDAIPTDAVLQACRALIG